jgi:DNA-binding CsgD family transcriptional regulator
MVRLAPTAVIRDEHGSVYGSWVTLVAVIPDPTISPREAEILAAVGERLSNGEIAARFHIGVRTVESHVSALLRKLGAADRRALAALHQASRSSAARHTVPPYLSVSVFGREGDVIGVGQLLTESRLVTLSGPGGVGKSTLALVLAGTPSVAGDHERVYVDLASVGLADDVEPNFASALGVDRDEQVSWRARLAEAIGTGKRLIVVDNAERVVDATADLINELLRRAGNVRFLVTSREPLSMPSERVWAVSPLAVTSDQAIALFCDRAAAVRPGWAPSEEGLQTVGVICERLDGLPLAIELAAAEVRARSVDEIARRLDEPLTLLEHGDRTERRHRTLRAVMDSSYDLLNADERAVFDRLGAFVAG